VIERLCIIGTGLIGGSLARALREAGACQEVVGAGRNTGNLQTAVDLGVIDRYDTDLAQAVSGADMVVVCVPLGAMEDVFRAIKDQLAEHAVLTDAGSAKGSVIEAVQRVFGRVPDFFVPGHPIAGTEQSGVEASFPGLYKDRRVILTPLPETSTNATDRVRDMWEAAGARVTEMDPLHHDAILAATSHLPHVLAYTLVDSLSKLASSDPVMWRDICLANGDAIQLMIEHFIGDLQGLSQAVKHHDGQQLLEIFTSAKVARDRYVEK